MKELEEKAAAPDLWNDPPSAQRLHTDLAHRRRELEPIRALLSQAEDLAALAQLAEEEASQEERRRHERDKIDKYAPPDNRRRGGAGRYAGARGASPPTNDARPAGCLARLFGLGGRKSG